MKRLLVILLLTLVLALPAQAEFAVEPLESADPQPIEIDNLAEAKAEAWNTYADAQLNDPTLIHETQDCAMTFGEATMRYTVQVIGDKPENGYPLYIAMHGGGSDDTPEFNDEQWDEMKEYCYVVPQCQGTKC